MAKFELKPEHIKLMTELNFRSIVSTDSSDRYRPAIDFKRPFGNSGATTNVCEIMGWYCDEKSEKYAPEDIERAETLIIELPVALQIVMQNHTFEPGIYEVGEYSSAYFNYIHIRNYHTLKAPISELEGKYHDCIQIKRLHELCMNISSDDPWEVINEFDRFKERAFREDAIAVFEKCKKKLQ